MPQVFECLGELTRSLLRSRIFAHTVFRHLTDTPLDSLCGEILDRIFDFILEARALEAASRVIIKTAKYEYVMKNIFLGDSLGL